MGYANDQEAIFAKLLYFASEILFPQVISVRQLNPSPTVKIHPANYQQRLHGVVVTTPQKGKNHLTLDMEYRL